MQEIWLPSNTPNSKAVGRFEEFTKHFTDRTGQKRTATKLMLYTKVPGVAEQSSQVVLDDAEGRKIRESYSAAWELYLKNKEATKADPTPTATEYGVKGTPIEHADFLGKDYIARLKLMGFLTIEQLADMSDAACNNLGFGAKQWRKKAAEVVARDQAAPAVPAVDPVVAELMKQLEEQKAVIALLMEQRTLQAEAAEVAKPRRGRPPKAAEAQPEA